MEFFYFFIILLLDLTGSVTAFLAGMKFAA
jgi:hypothetical protein